VRTKFWSLRFYLFDRLISIQKNLNKLFFSLNKICNSRRCWGLAIPTIMNIILCVLFCQLATLVSHAIVKCSL
jgi:hypothetical protein